MSEKNRYGTEKKLRVKGTSSHFTQPDSVPAFLFAFQRVYSLANATGETKPGY